MSSFTEPLILEVVQVEKRPFRLVRAFTYEVGEKGSGRRITVPEGFRTDGATVPWILQWLVPPFGRHGKAAVLHDWMYRSGLFPRRMADLIFLEAMEVLGVPRWRRIVMYAAVRAFGWIVYRRFNDGQEAKVF